MRPERTLALWCPDWAFAAAGLDPAHVPAATLRAGRVAACSWAARTEGVQRGMRKREAQAVSPELVLLDEDEHRSARAYAPVVEAVADLVPSVEVVRPGLCAIAVRRAERAYGGEVRLGNRLVDAVRERTGVAAETGIADGLFAALLAARDGVVVPVGGTPDYLAPFRIGVLDRPELADLLARLGVHTLGDLAALPAGEVLTRFGEEGAWAHRIASGTERRVRRSRVAPADLAVRTVLDPPVDRVDAAAFVARTLAESLHAGLAAHGLTCLRVAVEAETEAGEHLHRVWRHDGTLSAAALADRVRWQLDGWLGGALAGEDRPSAGLVVLGLVPDQVVPADGRQLDLVRSPRALDPERETRVDRALTRVQGLLGHESVLTAVLTGGRDPDEQVRFVPWTDPRDSRDLRGLHDHGHGTGPWPGALPDLAPATVLTRRRAAAVQDATGTDVTVTGRSAVSAPPARVAVDGGSWRRVSAWAGPWPADTRWWDPARRRRRARFQVVTDTGDAFLLVRENGSWFLDAVYD